MAPCSALAAGVCPDLPGSPIVAPYLLVSRRPRRRNAVKAQNFDEAVGDELDDVEERRRQRRLLKNRITAAMSRQRKKEELQTLKERVSELEDENRALRGALATRDAEMEQLRLQVERLGLMARAAAAAAAPHPPSAAAAAAPAAAPYSSYDSMLFQPSDDLGYMPGEAPAGGSPSSAPAEPLPSLCRVPDGLGSQLLLGTPANASGRWRSGRRPLSSSSSI